MARKRTKKSKFPVCVALVICDQVVLGNDGTPTLVRIVDTVGVPAEIEPGRTVDVRGVSLFLSLKNADAAEDYQATLSIVAPSGDKTVIGTVTVPTTGNPSSGRNVISPVRLPWSGEGLYWYEVAVADTLIARSPVHFVSGSPGDLAKKVAKTETTKPKR